MKLCLVYSPQDNKLQPGSYTSIFKDMFLALQNRFETKLLTDDCNAKDIDADLIFFFDPHATHHIKIDGIAKHPAMKMELWNDVHQEEHIREFKHTGVRAHKLGREQRAARALERGTDFIIVAAKYLFFELFEHLIPDIEKMTIYHPHAPRIPNRNPKLKERKAAVLGNGAYYKGSWRGSYDFRGWAFTRDCVEFVPHVLTGAHTPMASEYMDFLTGYAGAIAAAGPCPVPKYSEIPAAGCVTFAQYQKEYEEIGFRDYESCVYVRKMNFEDRVKDFLSNPQKYQDIADNGRKIMENYSAEKFADMVYGKANERIHS